MWRAGTPPFTGPGRKRLEPAHQVLPAGGLQLVHAHRVRGKDEVEGARVAEGVSAYSSMCSGKYGRSYVAERVHVQGDGPGGTGAVAAGRRGPRRRGAGRCGALGAAGRSSNSCRPSGRRPSTRADVASASGPPGRERPNCTAREPGIGNREIGFRGQNAVLAGGHPGRRESDDPAGRRDHPVRNHTRAQGPWSSGSRTA